MNLLTQETSPYLLQHKDNPVHWMPWGQAAFEKAAAENKPVLLSIGYAACHWCHVMAQESFEDSATADLMNNLFVNIKVDREELPDVDTLYQNTLALMGKQGGWPLTVFLTPDARAFWGGTYFPPHARHGLPAFREVLRGIAEAFAGEADKITHNSQSLLQALASLYTPQPAALPLLGQAEQAGDMLLRQYDPVYGGIGTEEGPKFPCIPALEFSWDCYIRTGKDRFKTAVLQSLISLCQGGIYDHIDGGFFRYTVDGAWQIPHFEKMLGDNAQTIGLLTEVYRETKNPVFAARIHGTIDWMMRQMRLEHGGLCAFAASLDADSNTESGEHEEGAYYIWRAGDVETTLGTDAEDFKKIYDITRFGNWPGKQGFNIPARLHSAAWLGDAEEARLGALCRKLRFERERRSPPARDDKILCDWNAQLATALCKASFVFQKPAWLQTAVSIFDFIDTLLNSGEDGLRHSWCAGKAGHAARLDDYAHYIHAALALEETAGGGSYLEKALTAAEHAVRIFAHPAGGFYTTPPQHNFLPLRPLHADDTAQPSGNAAMAYALQSLALATGQSFWTQTGTKTAEAFSGDALQTPLPRAGLLRAAFHLQSGLSLVIGGQEKQAREELAGTLREISVPSLVLIRSIEEAKLSPAHPAYGKKTDQPAAAWVCAGQRCLAPVTTPQALRDILQQLRAERYKAPANDE